MTRPDVVSREFLYRFEDEVNRARHEINEKHMSLAEVKARLAHIAGIDGLKVEATPRGDEIYTLGDVTAIVPRGNDRDSMIYLEQKLSNPFEQPKTEQKSMSITGIEPGIFEAKMAQMKKKLTDRLNGGLAKIDTAAEAGAVKMEAAVDGVVAKVDKEIDDKLAEFAQFTNGGPA